MSERFVPVDRKYVPPSASELAAAQRRIAELKREEEARETVIFEAEQFNIAGEV